MAWKHQTKRHSNAKKYGSAGGLYAKPKTRFRKKSMYELASIGFAQRLYGEDKSDSQLKHEIKKEAKLMGYEPQKREPKPKTKIPSEASKYKNVTTAIDSIEIELSKSGGYIMQGVIADILEKNDVYSKKDIDAVLDNVPVKANKSFIYDQMKTRQNRWTKDLDISNEFPEWKTKNDSIVTVHEGEGLSFDVTFIKGNQHTTLKKNTTHDDAVKTAKDYMYSHGGLDEGD